MTNKATVLISENILQATADAIRNKGGASGSIKPTDFAETIKAIATGGLDTSDATATAGEIFQGKTAYAQGRKLTGVMPNNGAIFSTMDGIEVKSVSIPSGYTDGGTISLTDDIDNEVDTQADLIEAITAALEGKVAGGGTATDDVLNAVLEGTITEISNDEVQVLRDHAFSRCPNLSMASFPACTTIGNSAFYWCSSLATISFPACTLISNYAFGSCSSLTAISFPACLYIRDQAFYSCSRLTTASFPVCSMVGAMAFLSCKQLSAISFPVCTTIGASAFALCYSLTSVSFPACATIGSYAFSGCSKLSTISFPKCTTIGQSAFGSCSRLTEISFPACKTVGSSAFYGCSNLALISLPACTVIQGSAFKYCRVLANVQLGGSSVCILSHSNVFSSTPFAGYSSYFSGTPYIYVPSSLITAYQSATNWRYFSSYFSAIESLEE